MFEGILSCVLDKNKQVQKAACSALATVEELSGASVLSQKTQVGKMTKPLSPFGLLLEITPLQL